MQLRSTFLQLLLLLLVSQSPRDTIRKYYEAAEAQRIAGNTAAAEANFIALLGEAHLRLANAYSAQKDFKEAATALEAAAQCRPDSDDVLIDLAIAYFNAGQYEKAFSPLGKVLGRNPQSAGARQMMGKTYFMLGDFQKSVSELEAALKLKPTDFDVAYTLGLAHLKQRQLAPAKQIYDQLIKAIGDRSQLRIVFGRAYRETGYLTEAIDEFKAAVALDPNAPRVHYYLGLTYLLKDGASRIDDAAKEFRIELASHPQEFFANYYLGILCVMDRNWEDAIALLEKASQIKPANSDPYFHLGQAYQGLNKHEKAIEALKKSIELNPDLKHNDYQVGTAHYRLGQSLIKIGRTDEGRKELQIASDIKSTAFGMDKERLETFLAASNQEIKLTEPVSAEGAIAETKPPEPQATEAMKSEVAFYTKAIATAYNCIGLLKVDRQDFRGAAVHFGLAAKWNPQHQDIHYNLGLAHYKAGSYKEAVPALEEELKANPANLSARQLLGLSYFITNDYSKAALQLADVVAAKPDQAPLYFPLALSLIKESKLEEANRVIQRMVAVNGNSPQLHILLSQAHYERGDSKSALEELGTALALDKNVRQAHFYSGVIYLKMGKLDEAAREFESELALNPGDLQAKYHLGFTLLARQDIERGIQTMREVIRAQPDNADAQYELGKALLQQSKVKDAVENLEAAVKLQPDKPHFRYQLGRAYLAAGRAADGEAQLEMARRLKEKERSKPNQ